MRAAEAIRLGSLVMKPRAGIMDDMAGNGCAMGMAGKAIGVIAGRFSADAFCAEWPWVKSTKTETWPCSCSGVMMGPGTLVYPKEHLQAALQRTMVHLFNYHVATKKDWTIDRLCEWLDSVDPTPRETENLAGTEQIEQQKEIEHATV